MGARCLPEGSEAKLTPLPGCALNPRGLVEDTRFAASGAFSSLSAGFHRTREQQLLLSRAVWLRQLKPRGVRAVLGQAPMTCREVMGDSGCLTRSAQGL